MNTKLTKEKRNYGIDALRVLTMFLIICHHILLNGVLTNVEFGTLKGNVIYAMYILVFCATDCYGLISGYVGVNKKVKYSNIAYLWIQVVFYTLISYLLLNYVSNIQMNMSIFEKIFTPVTSEMYWYFTTYFVMFFFTPFYNKLLDNLNKKELKYLGITLILILSVLSVFTKKTSMNSGFSWMWLSTLYLIGGIIRKLEIMRKENKENNNHINENKTKRKNMIWCVLIIAVCVLVGFISMKIAVANNIKIQSYMNYTSPFILIMAMAFLICFKEINIKNKIVKKIIMSGSLTTFGVYLIHKSRFFEETFMKNIYGKYACNYSTVHLITAIIVNAIFIFAVCSIIEYIRIKLFDLLKIKAGLRKIEEKLTKKVTEKIEVHVEKEEV